MIKKCSTWFITCGNQCQQENGTTQTPAIVSVNGGTGVTAVYITDDNDNNAPMSLCIPSLGNCPSSGTMVATNPSGHPGDGSVTGSISGPDGTGAYQITLCLTTVEQ